MSEYRKCLSQRATGNDGGALSRQSAASHAIIATRANHGDELISLEIRSALHELGTILGDVYTDDILDHIFSNFCIGK